MSTPQLTRTCVTRWHTSVLGEIIAYIAPRLSGSASGRLRDRIYGGDSQRLAPSSGRWAACFLFVFHVVGVRWLENPGGDVRILGLPILLLVFPVVPTNLATLRHSSPMDRWIRGELITTVLFLRLL